MPQIFLWQPDAAHCAALADALTAEGLRFQIVQHVASWDSQRQRTSGELTLIGSAALPLISTTEVKDHELVVLFDASSPESIQQALTISANTYLATDRPVTEVVTLVARLRKGAAVDESSSRWMAHTQSHIPRPALQLIQEVCESHHRLRKRYLAEAKHRQAVEEALRASETLYQSLVATLPMAMFRKDLNGRITFANRLMCEAIGLQAEEIVSRTDFDFFPPELAEKYRLDDEWVIEHQENLETVEEFRGLNGELRYMQVTKTPVFNDHCQVIGTQGMFTDVTARKQAELALDQERHLLDSLMRSIPDDIFFKDSLGRYLRINQAKAEMSGLSNPEIGVGRTDFDFFDEDYATRAAQDEQQVMTTGEPIINQEELEIFRDGRSRWISSTKLPLTDQAGAVVGTFGISRDITLSKEAEAALRVAKEAAESNSRAKSDFLANMSHEIRTPLNAILGLGELLLDTRLNEIQREYMQTLHESGEVLLEVINDILDFSKIEAGRLFLDQIPFRFREVLGDTVKTLGIRAHRKRLELNCRVHPDIPDSVLGDPLRLRQIVLNLIGNALKFTERGEVLIDVSIAADSQAGTLVDATLPFPANIPVERIVDLHFRVVDTGIGIPSDKFTAIFQAFEQADTSTTRQYGGTGLGLAISARLVSLMKGRIWLESEVDRGSTFHFVARFGVVSESVSSARLKAPRLLDQLPALVVDNSSRNRQILEELLGAWGMLPTVVATAREALVALEEQYQLGTPFALVLTDAHMPDADGFDLAQAMSQHRDWYQSAIMMLSSGDRPEELERCRELNVASYLVKPIKQSELYDSITRALGQASVTEERVTPILQRRPSRPLEILLAEDSPINQTVALGLLGRWGHRVTVANDGNEAVVWAAKRQFDVILMDVQMPRLDGLQATQAIREQESQGTTRLPIVAMTAHAMRGDRERCLKAGMDAYVSKPIRPELLFEVLERIAISRSPTAGHREFADLDSQQLSDSRRSGTLPAPVFAPPAPAAASNASGAAYPSPASTHSPAASASSQKLGIPKYAVPAGLAAPSRPVWDREAALAVAAGDPDLLRQVLETFMQETPALLRKLVEALRSNDTKTIQRMAHTIKSALRTVGAEELADAAERIELVGTAAIVEGQLRLLKEKLPQLASALRRYLSLP